MNAVETPFRRAIRQKIGAGGETYLPVIGKGPVKAELPPDIHRKNTEYTGNIPHDPVMEKALLSPAGTIWQL